jgi:hypothetical protein
MRAEESETCYRDHGSRSPTPVAVGFKWRSAVFRSRSAAHLTPICAGNPTVFDKKLRRSPPDYCLLKTN